MRFKVRTVLASAGVAAMILSAGPARGVRMPRIELLREVRVATSKVLLSDLLPAGAPESLRTRAGEISLGAAPQPGITRILDRESVEHRIAVSQGILLEVVVPERITVSRNVRPVTLTAVFDAIHAALLPDNQSAAGELRPEDILLGPQVYVSPGDPGLRVIRMEFDHEHHCARFLLWPSRDPEVLPFFVTADFSGEFSELLPFDPALSPIGLGRPMGNASLTATPKHAASVEIKQEFLVVRGERAVLHLSSRAVQISVNVIALERGNLGQQIRVRIEDTGKIFNAVVDGKSHLEVKF